jgi:uncharacterized protein YjbI with pentapeptide repeats
VDAALERLREGADLDGRGVPFTAALLEQVLDAIPDDKSRAVGHDACFSGATFADDADFSGATFAGDADFREATFEDNAFFGGATFKGTALFSETLVDQC